jgi:hypothetical protein
LPDKGIIMNLRTPLLAVSLVAGSILTSSISAADNTLWLERTYYSDATLTTIVGSSFLDCDGSYTISGTTTRFKTAEGGLCPNNPGIP